MVFCQLMHASTNSAVRARLKFSMSESHAVKTLQTTETSFCSLLIGRKNKKDLCEIIPDRIVAQCRGMLLHVHVHPGCMYLCLQLMSEGRFVVCFQMNTEA